MTLQGWPMRWRSLRAAGGQAHEGHPRFGQCARLVVLPALFSAAVYVSGYPREPDASYFVGGISLFPSPLGTVLGTAGGYTGLAILNTAATFAIILLVALIALELGTQPLVAQALALLVAPSEWFRDWGMDAPAVALLLAAALLQLRGRSRFAVAVAAIGAATHLAAIPLVVGALVARSVGRRIVWIAAGLVAAGAVLAYLTPYRSAFGVLRDPGAFVEGAHELLLACWPLLLLIPVMALQPRARFLVYGSALGAILAGAIPASVGQVGLTRYAVPCVFIAVGGLRFRRSLRPFHGQSRRHAAQTAPSPGA